jgi:signal transduction histidine kinase
VGIWVFAGFYFGKRISDLESKASAVSTRYIQSQQLLTSARTQVMLSSVYVRDALLDETPGATADGRIRINVALSVADQSLADYVPILNSAAEQAQIERLRQEIAELRDTTWDVLQAQNGGSLEAGPLLRDRIMPKREAVISVAEELGAVNRRTFVEHQHEIAAIYRETQTRIWEILGFALAASLGVAVLSTRYAGRLEQRVREQHGRDVSLQQDLRRLSNRLIRVREQERRSLARELHDEIGQLMTAIKVELAVAQRTLEERGDARGVLDDARPIADRALHAVRDLSHLLHPSVLDDLGLPAATEWFIKNFRKRYGLHVDFTSTGMAERLASDVETAAYRIIQESLANAAKHAAARRICVSIHCLSRLTVTVEDDGSGFEVGAPRAAEGDRGLGLVSMRERATQLDGTLTIDSVPGRGTRIIADLPAWPRDHEAATLPDRFGGSPEDLTDDLRTVPT